MRFELTAKTDIINFNGHRAVDRGTPATINIYGKGISPSTLFSDPSVKSEIVKQLGYQGIYLPPNRIGSAWWDVKVK